MTAIATLRPEIERDVDRIDVEGFVKKYFKYRDHLSDFKLKLDPIVSLVSPDCNLRFEFAWPSRIDNYVNEIEKHVANFMDIGRFIYHRFYDVRPKIAGFAWRKKDG